MWIVILSLITVCFDKSTRPQIRFSRTMRSIVQRLLVTVYHILCNTVYFIITLAYGFLSKKTLKVDMFPLHFIAIFPKFVSTFY